MGRALAHQATTVTRYSDPTALALLPDESRELVQRMRAGKPARNVRERLSYAHLERLSAMMVARTLAIDDAIVAAAAPQLVILGAGLDGRAWRMPELHDTVVYEVDHPDTQRDKRARTGSLAASAREIRFVPVDFTRDSLDVALAGAGHDSDRPTMWVWEGVVMYLTIPEIEASLAVIARRSAKGSRLAVLYTQRTALSKVVSEVVRKIGEPFRSTLNEEQMRALLAKYQLRVLEDVDIASVARALDSELGDTVRLITHLRLAVARRA